MKLTLVGHGEFYSLPVLASLQRVFFWKDLLLMANWRQERPGKEICALLFLSCSWQKQRLKANCQFCFKAQDDYEHLWEGDQSHLGDKLFGITNIFVGSCRQHPVAQVWQIPRHEWRVMHYRFWCIFTPRQIKLNNWSLWNEGGQLRMQENT